MDKTTISTGNTTENCLSHIDETKMIANQIDHEDLPKLPTIRIENTRICLIGTVIDDADTIVAAKTFNVPIVTSETGTEYINDTEWTTYFVMNDFDSTIYNAIHKSKHTIMGPPALKSAAKYNESLGVNNRPIYNYAMKGVITCFTGLRKKDELTRLVHLIHSMGGSIRKEMNSKVTHLICNKSGGEKYQYAMTFRLSVVRPDWVYAAWEKRNDPEFMAVNENFSENHKLKAFEGQRICFLGFPDDEKHQMIEQLLKNGGLNCDIHDAECSHVIIASTDAHYHDILPPSPESQSFSDKQDLDGKNNDEIDKSNSEIVPRIIDFDADENDHQTVNEENIFDATTELTSTPTKNETNRWKSDSAVLLSTEENDFIAPLSPILKIDNCDDYYSDRLDRIAEEDDELTHKRKRDSFDDMSIISTDSLAPNFASAKKPKLIRTGSITRTLRRSMSFASIKAPVSNLFRTRRNSVDPNSSITSIDSILNDSIKKPLKEKFRGIKERITRSSSSSSKNNNKSFNVNEANIDLMTDIAPPVTTPKKSNDSFFDFETVSFKTPKAPIRSASLSKSTSHTPRHSICSGIVAINKKSNDDSTSSVHHNNATPSRKSYQCSNNIIGINEDIVNTTSPIVSDNSICPVADMPPVVNEHVVQTIPELGSNAQTHILKADWFWYTIQNGFASESDHRFDDYLHSIANTSSRRDSHPSSNKRKRKRLSRLGIPDSTVLVTGKRRSSVSDAGLLSMSGSFLESTKSPDKHESRSKHLSDVEAGIDDKAKKSMRYNHFMDFFHTESNYVGILDTILTLFKIPLEDKADANENEALLNKSEIKAIFSNFLPIHHVHKKMLNSLIELKMNWTEDCYIGQIILDNRNDLIKAYPPYVNFFEQMKEALVQCGKEKPRFHAFLKINQSKPECGRQSLQDLMIRPVQRLPSISLLLNDILKHTPKSNPDYKKLDEALKAIKEVMTYINEDKRKTEGQLAMFDIFNDIDYCPPHLVSSHRNFVSKCEVTELSDNLSGRGDPLILFLFSDTLEVCKKRSRAFNSAKSPSTTINSLNTTRVQTTKPYKHIKLMPLSAIRLVYDVRDSPRAFALECRFNQDVKEKMYSFNICDEEMDKIVYLKGLCKQLAENACRTDSDNFLAQVESLEIDIDISEVNIGTLSKAFKFATRTRLKVGRALSFNKTPSKLKRAVSTMITSPFGSTHSIQAASQLANMKLGSCTNINEIHEEDGDSPTSSEILIAPMSVQPTRKTRNANLFY